MELTRSEHVIRDASVPKGMELVIHPVLAVLPREQDEDLRSSGPRACLRGDARELTDGAGYVLRWPSEPGAPDPGAEAPKVGGRWLGLWPAPP